MQQNTAKYPRIDLPFEAMMKLKQQLRQSTIQQHYSVRLPSSDRRTL
ncbi:MULTISPECIES: hypothetical protein [unclassified Chamaesiphon]|nr:MULTISPECIES: hypothetical protein [unclassified Chamaesiphon]